MSNPPPVPPEELLTHAAWLRRLAASLVGPARDADDLAQDTWVAALRRPPRGDRPLRPWLAAVLRNFLRMGFRSQRLRERAGSELAAAPTAEPPSPELLLGRLETQRMLARLVGELAEPFRSTVLLRFYEGLSAAEIARAQGIPAGTVRWRLKTGLDQLRAALDAKTGGDRGSWRLALLPLALPRWRHPVALALKGIFAMNRAFKVSLAVLLLLGLGLGVARWWPHKSGHGTPAPAPSPARAGKAFPAAPATPPAGASGPAAGAPIPLLAARAERDPSARNGTFEGTVVNWSTGRGVPAAELTFVAAGAAFSVATGADGRFRFAPTTAGSYVLQMVAAEGYLPFAPEWGHSGLALFARPGLRVRDIRLYLTPALDYFGQVLDPDGRPVAGATVRISDSRTGEQALEPRAARLFSDAQGKFVFHAPDGAIVEASDGRHAPGRAALDGPATGSHRVTIHLGPAGADPQLGRFRISGRVTDDRGHPIEGALVVARHESEAITPPPLHPIAQATTDEQGGFALAGLDAGRYTLAASHRGYATREQTAVEAGARAVALELAQGGIIAGRAVDRKGRPVPAFTVVVMRATGALSQVVLATSNVIDGSGQFELRGLPPGEVQVLASAAGFAQSAPIAARVAQPPDEPAPLELVLRSGATLKGTVLDRASGEPLQYARVSIDTPIGIGSSAVPLLASTVTDAEGAFTLTGIPPGTRTVLVAAYAHHMRMLARMQFEEDGVVGPITVDLAPTKPGESPQLELVGIGVALKPDGSTLLVNQVFPGSGAADAGISAGDRIIAIDGVAVAQLGFDGSLQSIRGPEGSPVRLTIRRGDAQTEVVAIRKRLRV
ncbi:MAG TPA: sigma-70 family RNA polymerase sigma factor [Polyangia bacterium]|nr:sigma-70 family RNA polymerase sigma factor [Polyangia bacterium]